MSTCFQVASPQLLSCSHIECPKTAIDRRPDKYQPAIRHDRATKVRRASFPLQLIYSSKWNLPNNLPCIYVHGIESPPRRFLAWPLVLVPEAGIFPFFGSSPVSNRRVSSLRLHFSNGAQFIYIHKQAAGSAVKRSSGPICPD